MLKEMIRKIVTEPEFMARIQNGQLQLAKDVLHSNSAHFWMSCKSANRMTPSAKAHIGLKFSSCLNPIQH